MLLEGEEEKLGALHRAIQWHVGNFLLSIVTHISTFSNTARAEKQARPKAALACNSVFL